MRICDHWSADPSGLQFEPLKLLNFAFNAEHPDPAFYYNADPDPDQASQNNADPDPQPCFFINWYGTVYPERWRI
jgi:hypothetical protein